jgi:CRISPR-associated protein Cas5h
MKVFSVDLAGDFAFFKKNDFNDMVYISYNFIHKPVLLGILGAIIGLSGYSKSGKGNNPEFYNKLKYIKLSIKPHYTKPLRKAITYFNNSSGLASVSSENIGQTWQIKEQILVGEPRVCYTIFIYEDGLEEIGKLKKLLKKGETEYPIYFGKNEHFAYYENYKEYDVEQLNVEEVKNKGFNIDSLVRESTISFREVNFGDFDPFDVSKNEGFTIYENLPYDFDENGFYKKDVFVLTGRKVFIKNDNDSFYKLYGNKREEFNVQFI